MQALGPVSWNFTGTVLPSLNTELPSALIGCSTPDQAYATLTVNGQLALFPAASVAVAVTVVSPGGKKEPDRWSELTPGVPQLSLAVGKAKLTRAPLPLAVQVANAVVPVGGQWVKVGSRVSWTVTVNLPEAVPQPLEAVQSTTVLPTGKL